MQLETARLGQSEHPQVLEETLHEVDLVDDVGQALWLVQPVEHRLDLAAYHGERRAELVTEIREQPASSLVLLLETGGHPVERAADRGQRTRLVDRDAHPGLTVAESLGGVDQSADRGPGPTEAVAGERDQTDQGQDGEAAEHEAPWTPEDAEEIGKDQTQKRADDDQEEGEPDERSEHPGRAVAVLGPGRPLPSRVRHR